MEFFTIMSNEIEGRIDPFYYRPEFRELKSALLKLKHKPLGEIIEFSSETWNQKDFFDGEFPYIEISEIDTATGEIKNIIYYEKDKAPSRAKMIVRENDIIVSITRPHRGAIALIDKSKDGFIASTGFAILRKLKIELNKKYLLFILRVQLSLKQMLQRSSGGNYPAITSEELKKIIIPLPPLSVQNRIVSLMEKAYSSKKSKETETQKLLDSINDYVLDELGIKLPELEDKMIYVVNSDDVKDKRIDAYYYQPKFEEIEKAVKKGKFEVRELREFIVKIYYGASVKNEYVDDGIPLLRIVNLKPNKFDLREVVKLPESIRKDLGNAFVKEGDLLISRSGTVGMVSVVPKEADGFAFGSFMIKFCLNEIVNKNYISAWLNTKLQKLLTERDKIGAIQGNITIETIENFKIPLPPLAVQNKIAEEIKKRMQKTEQLQKEAKEELEKAKQEVEKIILG